MLIIDEVDKINAEYLYPVSRKYFSIFLISHDLNEFLSHYLRTIPYDWPVAIFFQPSIFFSGKTVEFVNKAMRFSSAMVCWNNSDGDFGLHQFPHMISSCIGGYLRGGGVFFGGSRVPSSYANAASIWGYDSWYSDIAKLSNDVEQLTQQRLSEYSEIVMDIKVSTRMR